MGMDITIAETRRFELDCAFFGFDEERKAAAIKHLKSDPVIGEQRPDNSRLWEWQFGHFEITYAISEDFSRIVLLEVRPATAKQTKIIETIWDVIDKVNKIKRLFGL